MSNKLYDRLARLDESLQNRVTLRETIEKELRLQERYQNDFGDRYIILHATKIDSSEITEEKQKIKRK